MNLRERIERDISDETRAASIRSIFAAREAQKRPKVEPVKRPSSGAPTLNALTETPDEQGDGSDGFDWHHAAQSDYQAVCENQTGQIIPDEVFETGRLRRLEQEETSVGLALALDSTGRYSASPYYKGENHPNRATVIGLFSGQVLPMPAVKRSNVLPSVAKASRAGMLRFIEYYLRTLPGSGRKAAMFTITNGPRVLNDPVVLRDGIKAFHRWLSKMAASPAFKKWLLRMEWRATEFGEPKANAERPLMLEWHLHAHCLVTLPEGMTHRQRAKMRKTLWRLFGVIWDDAGDIQNPREFVKYPVKDSDLKTVVRDFGPSALADFCDAIRGMHIVQPMGEVKAMRKRMKENARRVTPFTRLDGRTLEETGDWNAGKRPLSKPNASRKAYRDACKEAVWRAKSRALPQHVVGRLADEQAETERLTGDDEGNQRAETPVSDRGGPGIMNRVIAMLAPAPYGGPICEPAVTVTHFNGDVAAVLRQPRVAAVIARHRRAFEDAEAARALIRACAGTPAPASIQGSQRSNNCPHADSDPRPRKRPDAWANVGWTELLALN